MNKLSYVFYLVLVVCLASCTTKERKPIEKVESLKVLIAKTTEVRGGSALDRGYTKYLLAFSDGHTENTSFGWYTCLQVGDTVRFVKDKGDSDFWLVMKPNCN
jgi:hypothetical protein